MLLEHTAIQAFDYRQSRKLMLANDYTVALGSGS
jgi:hypothetical protein